MMARRETRQAAPGDDGCLPIVLGQAEAEGRLRRTSESFAALMAYREMASKINDAEVARAGSCVGLEPIIRERAWSFEASTRVIAADALQSVNELRDAGELQSILLQAAKLVSNDGGDIAARLRVVQGDVIKAVPGLDERLLSEAVSIAGDREISLSRKGDSLEVGMIGVTGERASQSFTATPGPGSKGRVGVRDFFSGEGRVVSSVRPTLLLEPDCHRASRMDLVRLGSDADIYASFVGGLASMRETSYRHARRVNEVGHSGFNPRDPITAIVVAAVVVGAILIAAGIYVIASGGDVNLGIFLIGAGVIFVAGGICVALGACTFVLAILIGVGA